MRLSKCIQFVTLLITALYPSSKVLAYDPALIGIKGALGGVTLCRIKSYATKHGYKAAPPFSHSLLEGTLCMKSRLLNSISSMIESGYSYMQVLLSVLGLSLYLVYN